MNKNESKYFNTAILFDETLIYLLEKKDIEYITIKEICIKAGVNRSTFYLHYESINDLVEETMNYINKKFEDYFNENSNDFINKIKSSSLEELNLVEKKYLTPYLTFIKDKFFYETEGQKEGTNNSNNIKNTNISNSTINQEQKDKKYADDTIINNFIKNFKTVSNYNLNDIRKGNIRTKYFVNINGQYCQLLNAIDSEANYFEIIINGGNQKDDIDKTVVVYKEVIKSLDSTITDTKINDTISTYINNKTVPTTFSISDKIIVKFYPSVSLSKESSDCRIEITTTIYN